MLTDAQHELRRQGIGGSEIAAIMGLSSFLSPLDVYLAKVEGWRKPETDDMVRGQCLESGLLDWYARRLQIPRNLVVSGSTIHATGLGAVVATPDAIVETPEGLPRIVEVKCPRHGSGWESGPPEAYLLQAQWTWRAYEDMSETDVDGEIHVVALLDGDLCVFPVQADVELQNDLLAFTRAWWARHVVAKVPPPLDGGDGAHEWLKRRFPTSANPIRPATPAEDLLMLDLMAAEAGQRIADDAAAVLEQRLKESIGGAAGIESPAGRITWKSDKNGKRSFRTKWSQQ